MASRLKKGSAIAAAAIAVVSTFEGLRTVAYRDPIGIPTVCFGETRGVKMGDGYTVAQCKEMLGDRLVEFETGMRACLKRPDAIPAGAYVASLSISYNIGTGAFCKSSLCSQVECGRYRRCLQRVSEMGQSGRHPTSRTHQAPDGRTRPLPQWDSVLMPILYAIARYLGFGGCIALGLLGYYEGIPGASKIPFLSNVPVIGDLATGKVHSYAAVQVRLASARMVSAFEYGVLVAQLNEERLRAAQAAQITEEYQKRTEAAVRATAQAQDKLEKIIAEDTDADSPLWADRDYLWLCEHGSKAPQCSR
jgi:lysozyme